MATFFQFFDSCSIFGTREEAERLATDRWESAQKAAEIVNDKELWSLTLPEFLSRVVTPVEIDAELLYCHNAIGSWSIWSDGKIRPFALKEVYRPVNEGWFDKSQKGEPCNFLMDRVVPITGGSVSPGAAAFVSLIRGSDSDIPEWLGRVRHVELTNKTKSEAKSGGYAGPALEHYTITLDNGEVLQRVALTEGYFEGYVADLFYSESAALRSRSRRNWIGTECFECGAQYDKSGFVEPGEMGCDRCNSEATNWAAHIVE